jgi:DNA-binding PucR family transcriptional regulator
MKLKDIDVESGTDYLPTLSSFVQNGMNQTDTAKALDIHRTTLIYRLRRISEYTNLDLNDHKSLLHAAISLEMLKD